MAHTIYKIVTPSRTVCFRKTQRIPPACAPVVPADGGALRCRLPATTPPHAAGSPLMRQGPTSHALDTPTPPA